MIKGIFTVAIAILMVSCTSNKCINPPTEGDVVYSAPVVAPTNTQNSAQQQSTQRYRWFGEENYIWETWKIQ